MKRPTILAAFAKRSTIACMSANMATKESTAMIARRLLGFLCWCCCGSMTNSRSADYGAPGLLQLRLRVGVRKIAPLPVACGIGANGAYKSFCALHARPRCRLTLWRCLPTQARWRFREDISSADTHASTPSDTAFGAEAARAKQRARHSFYRVSLGTSARPMLGPQRARQSRTRPRAPARMMIAPIRLTPAPAKSHFVGVWRSINQSHTTDAAM